MEIRSFYKNLTENDIQNFCNKIEIQLPKEYINFLLKNNGGQPKSNHFEKNDSSGSVEYSFYINSFYGIGGAEDTSGELMTMFAFSDGIPDELLPIADDGISNTICLGVDGEYFGKVFIWWKDGEVDEDEKPTFDNVDLVTDSFDEFINGSWT